MDEKEIEKEFNFTHKAIGKINNTPLCGMSVGGFLDLQEDMKKLMIEREWLGFKLNRVRENKVKTNKE